MVLACRVNSYSIFLAMTSITEKIQRILRSTLSSNVVDDDNKIQDKTPILSSETQNRLKLREVLEDQHRIALLTILKKILGSWIWYCLKHKNALFTKFYFAFSKFKFYSLYKSLGMAFISFCTCTPLIINSRILWQSWISGWCTTRWRFPQWPASPWSKWAG